jgi:hypothetical protein
MLVQTSSPRPLLNVAESPQHIKVHTIRRAGISSGSVMFNFTTDAEHGDKMTVPLEPYEVFPIVGEPGFEALEYYLPFSTIFGTERAVYDEHRLLHQLQAKPSTALAIPHEVIKRDDHVTKPTLTRLRDTQLALLSASGFHVIAKSAHRVEGSKYAERIFNFTVLAPVTGGGIIRVVGSEFDVTNPTFDPKTPIPQKTFPNSDLHNAFNRTHKLASPEVEDRKKRRIAEAEANLRANERGLAPKKDD